MSISSIPTMTPQEQLVQRPSRRLDETPARLALPGSEGSRSLSDELELGFFGRADDVVPLGEMVDALEAAGLRGRGGAGFPAHIKWRSVADATGSCVVVANGHEGEPASAKDQWLLTRRPHLVIDGLLLAARVIGAQRAVLYVSHPRSLHATRAAVAEVEAAGLVPDGTRVEVFASTGGYVAGEETAVCRGISGHPALPVAKPPRPSESGVDGLPTPVNNVETLAHAARIRRYGADAFCAVGTDVSPGTTLFTISGAALDGGVVEAPLGTTVGQLVARVGGTPSDVGGLLMGGWFGGLLKGNRADLSCCYAAVSAAGSGLGCAAITVLGHDEDPLTLAARLGSLVRGRERPAVRGVPQRHARHPRHARQGR
ncbi:hypothetical protein [Nocardioides sp. B-3]|uniref:hypothetical protein n=1 Tax=Nocardioides sp. B-3 TaxID=2895565 RepID=UPI002152828A|nr:hypothetical protein [Nocardioides sp. B-3]UUZ59495.1 hypothetical protein LP418_27590 [Nocardioides sp. B-3]